ncbi:hypothetical protein VBD025_17670 [Virgibacillus flavescens]
MTYKIMTITNKNTIMINKMNEKYKKTTPKKENKSTNFIMAGGALVDY